MDRWIFIVSEGVLVSMHALSKAAHSTLLQPFLMASFSLRDHEWPRQKSLTSAPRAEGTRGTLA